MYSIIQYLPKAIAACFGSVDISPLPTEPKGKLRLTPVQFLHAIHAHQLAQFALHLSRCFSPRCCLPRHAGGRPPRYTAVGVVLGGFGGAVNKVHMVLCKQADLPLLGVLTTANVHDSVVGWALLLLAHWIYGLSVQVVYADSA